MSLTGLALGALLLLGAGAAIAVAVPAAWGWAKQKVASLFDGATSLLKPAPKPLSLADRSDAIDTAQEKARISQQQVDQARAALPPVIPTATDDNQEALNQKYRDWVAKNAPASTGVPTTDLKQTRAKEYVDPESGVTLTADDLARGAG